MIFLVSLSSLTHFPLIFSVSFGWKIAWKKTPWPERVYFSFRKWKHCQSKKRHLMTGADLGFSRGGGADFQKKFENFVDLFFLDRPN